MKTVFRLTLWFIGILLMPGLQAATTQGPLVLGAERMDVITRLLKDKQVGLVINQTSILEKQQKHLLDALVEKGIQLKKVFYMAPKFLALKFHHKSQNLKKDGMNHQMNYELLKLVH